MSLPVRTTPDADAQIHEVDGWWRRHRLASPNLFFDELTASFDIIGHASEIGRLYRQSPVPRTRRVLLMMNDHERERRLRVFLCHSSADKLAVRELYQRLTSDGCEPW